MTRWWAALLVVAATAPATADPLRLRADALAGSASPVGLVTLRGDGAMAAALDAEAVVWFGADGDGALGDALVMEVIARRGDGRAEARFGRMVVTTGALVPLHLDGVAGRARVSRRFDLAAFAGVPAVPRLGARAWDWAAGGRVGRSVGDWGGAGVAIRERRTEGRLVERALGVDAAAARGRLDGALRTVVGLVDPGLAELTAVVTRRWASVRVEASASRRVASQLLPATSLFTVLGDVASDRVGGSVRWRAAPRLDVAAELGARRKDDHTAPDAVVRATLALDDARAGALVGELRRGDAPDGGWTGARVALRVPRGRVTIAIEGELAIPDVDRGRGAAWPWGLAAIGWRGDGWDAGVAVEVAATPAERSRFDVMAQLGRQWEVP